MSDVRDERKKIEEFMFFPNEFINNIAHVATHLWCRCSAGATNLRVNRGVLSTKLYPPLEGAVVKENTHRRHSGTFFNYLYIFFIPVCVSVTIHQRCETDV